jgi:hypothetical protein
MKTRKPMPRMVDVTCQCGVEFKARAADVKRGWGKYHDKSCAAKYRQEARDAVSAHTDGR